MALLHGPCSAAAVAVSFNLWGGESHKHQLAMRCYCVCSKAASCIWTTALPTRSTNCQHGRSHVFQASTSTIPYTFQFSNGGRKQTTKLELQVLSLHLPQSVSIPRDGQAQLYRPRRCQIVGFQFLIRRHFTRPSLEFTTPGPKAIDASGAAATTDSTNKSPNANARAKRLFT